MDLHHLLEESRLEEERLQWEGSFDDYLRMATTDPRIARLSHARVYDMILAAGVQKGPHGAVVYQLFEGEIFGLDRALAQIVDYFAAAARRLEVRKRILLLLGPVASGKSSIATLLKRGLEAYSRSEEGALYAIKGCPMQEEPLHLIPEKFRPELLNQYGLYIEGDLCPHCRYELRHTYGGRLEEVRVRRIVLSEREGVGIGTFLGTDPGSQDLARLVGSIDQAALGGDRLEEAGRAYRLDGELNVANRGLMEFIEMLKSDERFLTVLLSLTQEQTIKVGRFGSVYADEAVISHTNEAEYKALVENKRSEALQDRIIVARIPYTLKVGQEVRIYSKLLAESTADVHFSPLALSAAAVFAVLSRLEPSQQWGMTLAKKMRLYDAQFVEGYTHQDVLKMQEERPDEGMHGISPRYIINQLSRAVLRAGGCLTPALALEALAGGIEQHPALAREERERLRALVEETGREGDELAVREGQRACVEDFEDTAARLLRTYLAHAGAALSGDKVKGAHLDEEADPDEKLLRSLEEAASVREHEKDKFRREMVELYHAWPRNRKLDYSLDERMRHALEAKLYPDARALGRLLLTAKDGDVKEAGERERARRRLIKSYGYCQVCAADLFRHLEVRAGSADGLNPPRGRRRWLL